MRASSGTTWAVELNGVTKRYRVGLTGGFFHAIKSLSLQLARGQVVGLLGPNGSGKSTTLKLLAGLIGPSAGEARIFGELAGSSEARALVGYLTESPQFSLHLSGREFLAYCAGLSAIPMAKMRARVDEVIEWSGLAEGADRKIGTYSKGMLQRLGLAQAILHDPALVLLDEPASGLDPEGRLALSELIRGLAVEGKTVVFSSHLLTQTAELCDRIAILGRGQLLVEGATAALLGSARPAVPVEASPLEKLYLEKLRHVD